MFVILLGAVGFSTGRHFGKNTDMSVQGCFVFGLAELLSDASMLKILSACFFAALWHGVLIGGGCLAWGTFALACFDFFGLCFKCGVADNALSDALKWNSFPAWGITGGVCVLFGILLTLAFLRRIEKPAFRLSDRYDRKYILFIFAALCACVCAVSALCFLLRVFDHPLCGLWLTAL